MSTHRLDWHNQRKRREWLDQQSGGKAVFICPACRERFRSDERYREHYKRTHGAAARAVGAAASERRKQN